MSESESETHNRDSERTLDIARRRLLKRLDAKPYDTWSAPLLTTVCAVIDAFDETGGMFIEAVESVPRLRLVE